MYGILLDTDTVRRQNGVCTYVTQIQKNIRTNIRIHHIFYDYDRRWGTVSAVDYNLSWHPGIGSMRACNCSATAVTMCEVQAKRTALHQ